jgi:hypothetical protein
VGASPAVFTVKKKVNSFLWHGTSCVSNLQLAYSFFFLEIGIKQSVVKGWSLLKK